MPSVYALIPARGGSKGIKHKNICPLNGRPMLSYTIEAAQESGLFANIVVSSDDEETLTITRQHRANTDRRDPALAQDNTPMDIVIGDFIRKRQLVADAAIVLLQPTSPLRRAKHIVEAWRWFIENECDVLVSVYPIDNKVLKAYVVKDKFLLPIYNNESAYTRRQDLPGLFMPNGAIYIFTVASFQIGNCIPRTNILPFTMSEHDSLDVDSEDDLRLVSRRLIELQETDSNG